MICVFCKLNNAYCSNSKFNIWKCDTCKIQFIINSGSLDYLCIMYKCFRIFYYRSPFFNTERDPVCFLQKSSLPFSFNFVCDIDPKIITLSIDEIHKKIDRIDRLMVFL